MFSPILYRCGHIQPPFTSSVGRFIFRSPSAVSPDCADIAPVLKRAQCGARARSHPEFPLEGVQSGPALPKGHQTSVRLQQQVQVRTEEC